ncbi:YibE/F family protein, partial [uncultured Mobiluncus sp.]
TYTRREIYQSAMRIGRDHIASTIYTIVFAYTGAALSTVMLIVLFFERSLSDLFTTEALAAQALQILASGSALIASVPITTAIATLAVRKPTGPVNEIRD